MFTGIVEETGTLLRWHEGVAGARLTIGCDRVLSDAKMGSSIAVNGVCLTALELSADSFAADLAPETLRRTNLGDLIVGSKVNLERPLLASDRLSGHVVQGHVDGTGEVAELRELGDGNWWLTVQLPSTLLPYVVMKGSIAIDGISLTIAQVDADRISVAIIPHTYAFTNLHQRRSGERVNIETDILAKQVERLLEFRR